MYMIHTYMYKYNYATQLHTYMHNMYIPNTLYVNTNTYIFICIYVSLAAISTSSSLATTLKQLFIATSNPPSYTSM